MDNSTSNIFIELDKDNQKSSHKIRLVPIRLEGFVNAIAFNKKYNNKDIVKIKLNDTDLQNLVQIDSSEIDTPRNKNMMNDQIFTIASYTEEMKDANTRKSKRKSKIDSSRSVDRFDSESRVDSGRQSQRLSDKSGSSKSKLDPRITVYKDTWGYHYTTNEPSKTAIRDSDFSWQSAENSEKRSSSNLKSSKRSSSRIGGKYTSIYPDRSSKARRKSSRSRVKKEIEYSRKINVGPDEHDLFTVTPNSSPEKLVAEIGTSTDQSSREDVIKYSKKVGTSTNDERKQRYTNKSCKVCRQHCEFCFCHVPYTKTYSERECKRLKCGCWDCKVYGLPTQRKKKPGLLDRIYGTLLKPKCYYKGRVYNGPEKISHEDYHPKKFNLAENKIICDSCIMTSYTTPVIDKTGKLHLVLNKQGHPM